jgi:hypothetical protein
MPVVDRLVIRSVATPRLPKNVTWTSLPSANGINSGMSSCAPGSIVPSRSPVIELLHVTESVIHDQLELDIFLKVI